jgi:hypothetical protein
VTDTNVFQLAQPGNFADPLTEVLRKGARALLAQAVEAEVATLLSRYADGTTVIQEKPPSRTQEKTQTRFTGCEAGSRRRLVRLVRQAAAQARGC